MSHVFAVADVPPEMIAYALARYSRSAQSLTDHLHTLSAERASAFLERYYLEYGHASIADMAHIVLAIEQVSLLAAFTIVDETLWDGQERSTRYQDFAEAPYYVPPHLGEAEPRYHETMRRRLLAYRHYTQVCQSLLRQILLRPDHMTPTRFSSTILARALDVSRSFLPLGMLTSVGQVTSARVLERQIGRLLASPLEEARVIAAQMADACRAPALTLQGSAAGEPQAPTLIKHAGPAFQEATVLEQMRREVGPLLADWKAPAIARAVTLAPSQAEGSGMEQATVATLSYLIDPLHRSYLDHLVFIDMLPEERQQALFQLSLGQRGEHDEFLRALRVGYGVVVDFCLDAGALRDLHRHRRCVQFLPAFTADLGHMPADQMITAGLGEKGAEVFQAQGHLAGFAEALDEAMGEAASFPVAEVRPYLLPLAARQRALFKMDMAEALYIAELRSRPNGHFSYREAAFSLYEQLAHRFHLPAALRVRVSTEHSLLAR